MSDAQVTKDKKQKPAPAPTLITDFEAAEELAKKLIPKYHEHLATANIIFSCTNKVFKAGGRVHPGKVKKTTPMDKFLSKEKFRDGDVDFIITISLESWNPLTPQQRVALVDHLLSRLQGEEDEHTGAMKFKVVSPGVQEFSHVVERHGTWNESLEEIKDCMNSQS